MRLEKAGKLPYRWEAPFDSSSCRLLLAADTCGLDVG